MLKPIQNTINITETLTILDWVVFITILLITISSVLYGQHLKKKQIPDKNRCFKNNVDNNSENISSDDNERKSFLDLILMGRQLTLPLFIATLVATWYGGIFGVTRIAFETGIYNFVTQGAFWYVAYLIFAFFLVSRISRYKAVTLPDLIDKMFGPASSKLSAVFNFFNVLPVVYVISLGIFLQMLLGGELLPMMILGVSIVVLYSMFGGFRAVVFSDLVQFVVMCLAVFIVLVISVYNYGGYGFLSSNLPSSYFSPTGSETLGTTLVWGFIALSTLVDPNFYQRCFAARSSRIAKRGIIFSTIIWFCFDICTTFGAMYAKATIPEAESTHAYLIYAIQILPSGVRGFVLAGILATILSTLDSYLFLAGTTISYDLVPKRFKGKILLHHLGIILVGIISVLMAVQFDGNIKTVWKTLGSYSAACLLLPVLYGHLFPKKITDFQFVFACLLGMIGTTFWKNVNHTGPWINVDELYIGIICTTLGLLLFRPTYQRFRIVTRFVAQIF